MSYEQLFDAQQSALEQFDLDQAEALKQFKASQEAARSKFVQEQKAVLTDFDVKNPPTEPLLFGRYFDSLEQASELRPDFNGMVYYRNTPEGIAIYTTQIRNAEYYYLEGRNIIKQQSENAINYDLRGCYDSIEQAKIKNPNYTGYVWYKFFTNPDFRPYNWYGYKGDEDLYEYLSELKKSGIHGLYYVTYEEPDYDRNQFQRTYFHSRDEY